MLRTDKPDRAAAVMSYVAQKCGVCFQPPSIVLIYKADDGDKTRRRVMPVRNFSEFSGGVTCDVPQVLSTHSKRNK